MPPFLVMTPQYSSGEPALPTHPGGSCGTELIPWSSMIPGTNDQGLAKAGSIFLAMVIDSGMSTDPKWSKETISLALLELLGRRRFSPNRVTGYRDDTVFLVGICLPRGKRLPENKTDSEKSKEWWRSLMTTSGLLDPALSEVIYPELPKPTNCLFS